MNEKTFAAICYLVLMDHHGDGFFNLAHPDYVREKLSLLDRGFEAYHALDHINQGRVRRYLKEWKCEFPVELEHDRQIYP